MTGLDVSDYLLLAKIKVLDIVHAIIKFSYKFAIFLHDNI